MAKLVSKTYGEALYEIATQENITDSLYEEVLILQEILEQNPEFSKLMEHPGVAKPEKLKLLEDIFADRISKELMGFLETIIMKERYHELPQILGYFVDRVKAGAGIGIAYVQTAVPLTDMQRKEVENKLLATTSYHTMEMHFAVNPELIGGIVIRINDRVVDSSVATKLNEIKRQLLQIQLS